MILLESVKRLLLISFLIPIGMATDFKITPDLECGNYIFKGLLRQNNNGNFIVTARAGTSSPIEFILLGGSISHKLSHLNTKITVEAYVPKPIKSNQQTFIFFRKFLKEKKAAKNSSLFLNGYQLETKKKCGLSLNQAQAL